MSITSPAAEIEVPEGPQKKVQLETDNIVTEDVYQIPAVTPPTVPATEIPTTASSAPPPTDYTPYKSPLPFL